MKKTLLWAALLAAVNLSAQDFEWQWAKRGGGVKLSPNETEIAYNFDSEQVLDIAIDEDNNYYYLAFITQQSTAYEDIPVTVYNSIPQITGSTDIFIWSTDCQGNLRWTQTIGGGSTDYAYKIQLDNNGGLYIAANIINLSNFGTEYLSPHFSPDDAQPGLGDDTGQPQEGYKTIALLKYNTINGELAWRVMPQGNVTMALRSATINQVVTDADGTLHTLIGFRAGTHLNGAITVPQNFTDTFKYYIVTYNSDGVYQTNIPLALEGYLLENNTEFRYDESLGRYYIAGYRTNGDIFVLSPLALNGTELTQQAFVMAFNSAGSNLWVKEISSTAEFKDNRIYDIKIDADSSLYLSGKYYINSAVAGITFGEYNFQTVVEGNVPYVLKLNTLGAVQWMTTPTGYTTQGGIFTGSDHNYSVVINGSELAVATQVSNEMWGTVTVNRPANHRSDPALLRLNKNTGAAIALHDVMGAAGFDDALTAVAVDNDGNYVTGGYFYTGLFTDANDNVPTLNKVLNEPQGTDFFIAKLAATPCGTPVAGISRNESNEVIIYPNPSSGLVNIQTDAVIKNYIIINSLGQVVAHDSIDAGNNTVSVQNLTAGVYIISLNTQDNGVITKKIVRE